MSAHDELKASRKEVDALVKQWLADAAAEWNEPAEPQPPTCSKCGERVTRDWSGWMHLRKPSKAHRPQVTEESAR